MHAIWQAPRIPVGASLLAKASAHSPVMAPDTPHSRAGSLPQKSKAAQLPAAKPPHSTMSASSSNAFDLAFDPRATSEG
ncbi:hypothetical protein E1508_16865 [Pseudomonas moraviensis]|nr:hypothetical protein E1508_16865 [Pseudomonas moraviensis]